MSDVTTVTISEETRDQLEDHRHDSHHSVEDVIKSLIELAPSMVTLGGGCGNCGRTPNEGNPPEDRNMVLQRYYTTWEGEEYNGLGYFCSVECAQERQEENRQLVPENPEQVLIGGHEEIRVSVENATYYRDPDIQEVGIPIPGAFSGTDAAGEDYEYIGEPVYIQNKYGEYPQSGVIEEIIHEDGHTTLVLGSDYSITDEYRPDEDKKEVANTEVTVDSTDNGDVETV